MYGYNRIPASIPLNQGRKHSKAWRDSFAERLRERMIALGFMDAWNSSFIGKEDLDQMRIPEDDNLRRAVEVLNPLSSGEGLLRTSLLPSLLAALGRNARRFNPRAALFEIARVYLPE